MISKGPFQPKAFYDFFKVRGRGGWLAAGFERGGECK